MLALASVEDAIAVLRRARKAFDTALTGYELMAGVCLDMVNQCFPQQKLPFAEKPTWYALLEISDSEGEEHARGMFEAMLGEAFEAGEIADAVIAENLTQSKDLWHLRESITLAQAQAVKSIKHDISVPVSNMVSFIEKTDAQLQEKFPGLLNMTFGHLGDGNLHYNVGSSERFSGDDLMKNYDAIYNLVHDNAHAHQGSISAEHGIGSFKIDELPRYKAPRELELMKRIKAAFDPANILNPGKVLR
jgi:FAD/FMN-containing dehydrogenase